MWVSKVRSEDEAGVIVVLKVYWPRVFQSLVTLEAAILSQRTRRKETRTKIAESSKLWRFAHAGLACDERISRKGG
jgi:hypothetical protein